MNLMSLRFDHKAIPYSAVDRGKSGKNYGFMDLKSGRVALSDVPELVEDEALRQAIERICSPECGLFSVGCLSAPVKDDKGQLITGYIEFCRNSKALSSDASTYFPIFFHFGKALHANQFAMSIKFDWELQPAMFTDHGSHIGFTCAVFINTCYFSTPEGARSAWNEAVEVLGKYLMSVPADDEDALY